MSQQWRDLTFLHWAVDPARVRHLMPPGCAPDTFEGRSYVGLVPFRMVGAGFGRGRPVPWLGTFLETNVRLYSVDSSGRRGVVFLSLDTDRLLVVAGARAGLALPYRWARMRHQHVTGPDGERHTYDARLRRPGARVDSHVEVRVGDRRTPTPLDHFLSARWRLHTRLAGRTLLVPNAHEPWPLHDASVLALDDGLVRSVGLGNLASHAPDHVAFSPAVHSEFGLPRRAC
ncbi:DUF2071 domain-containing protein [Nocardioides mesophilus]|uniref:DUF2071 domain-containing protein n=2 Tax=Nocardioides mesophilus TaxID=433659 RepID=A0A7G9RH11_9ACTN|nr:DUF2071 domain-containing protein [Nocardioides mesophilus]